MKKSIALLSFLVLIIISKTTNAQDYRHQLGVRIGSTDQVLGTGFTYRYLFANNTAIEGIMDLKDDIALGALYEKRTPLGNPAGLGWYYGAGAYVGFGKENNLGATGILGMEYQFSNNLPINVSIDWKPELNLVRDVAFRAATIGVSVRFSFGGSSTTVSQQK